MIPKSFNVFGLLEVRYDELIVRAWSRDDVYNQDHRIEIHVELNEEASYLFDNLYLPAGFAAISFVAQISKDQEFQISIPYTFIPVLNKENDNDITRDLLGFMDQERVNTLIQVAIVKLADEFKMELVIGEYKWIGKMESQNYPTVDVKSWLKPLYKS